MTGEIGSKFVGVFGQKETGVDRGGGADKKLDKIRNTKEDNYLVLR